MHKILTLNNISPVGLEKLPKTLYNFGPDIEDPEAIILRSFKMHDMEIPESLLAVGRAGAGVNNIPVDKLTEMGIPVFNAPGANANAVKELVVAGLLLAFRNICEAWDYVRNLDSSDAAAMSKSVEEGKKTVCRLRTARAHYRCRRSRCNRPLSCKCLPEPWYECCRL